MVRVSLKLVSQTGRNFEPNTTFALNCAKQYSSPTFNRIIQGTRMVITCMIHNYGQFRQNKISCICQEQVLHDVRVMLAQESKVKCLLGPFHNPWKTCPSPYKRKALSSKGSPPVVSEPDSSVAPEGEYLSNHLGGTAGSQRHQNCFIDKRT